MTLRDWLHRIKRFFLYHPERHYMRGKPSGPDAGQASLHPINREPQR